MFYIISLIQIETEATQISAYGKKSIITNAINTRQLETWGVLLPNNIKIAFVKPLTLPLKNLKFVTLYVLP